MWKVVVALWQYNAFQTIFSRISTTVAALTPHFSQDALQNHIFATGATLELNACLSINQQ